MKSRLIGLALGLAALAGLAGCSRADRLAITVDAKSPIAFAMWRAQVGSDFAPAEWHDFDAALQEIRFQITADYQATGSEAVDAALRERINGQAVRAVLVMGTRARLRRLQGDRSELEHFLAENATLRTRPDDRESMAYLRAVHDRQAAQLVEIKTEIAIQEARLSRLVPAGTAKGHE